MTQSDKWWGKKVFSNGNLLKWSIGERFIALQKEQKEWAVYNFTTSSEEDLSMHVDATNDYESLSKAQATRFVLPTNVNSVLVEPSLADRAMIAKPSTPLLLMPNESIQVFISTPLWMTILYEEKDLPLLDVPFWRPSDSWFGSNTMHGDLCYAKYTDAALSISASKPRSHRALTAVTIINAQDLPLSVERINLPTPNLQVFVDETGHFWSEDLIIEQTMEHGIYVSNVTQKHPSHSKNLTLVSESRLASNKHSLLSTLRNLVA